MIGDPTTSLDDLVSALKSLGPVQEPPSFWRQIAEGRQYSDAHRALAIIYLIHRHASSGITVGQLATVLGCAPWLSSNDVEAITTMAGELPVHWNENDSYFVLRLPAPQSQSFAVYLRVRGKVDRAGLLNALHCRPVDQRITHTPIVELGFSSPIGAPSPVRSERN